MLDVAAGSGDLAIRALEFVQPTGTVVMCDINDSMLEQGRNRCLNLGKLIPVVKADAESLPFKDESFDIFFSSLLITIFEALIDEFIVHL